MSRRCRIKQPRGWHCTRGYHGVNLSGVGIWALSDATVEGPCALVPSFWAHPVIWFKYVLRRP